VGRIYALCLRLSADALLADELTQDVFVRAWEKLGTYRGESVFSTWLHRLAVNVVLEKRRSERRRTARVMVTDDASLLEGVGASPAPEVGMDLDRAIASLPKGARTVFVMHDVEGYRHDEIAELTGLAPGTCRAQLHRARRLLRETLEG
jgi:RNA polymerase sigma-70 factor (ECF subfamily)